MTRQVKLEFFFDCSSPFTYLGFHNIQPLAARHDVSILWRPITVGGVFNAVNRSLYDQRANPPVPRKAEYAMKDMQDWARLAGLTIVMPPPCGHPVNSITCMRASLVLQREGKVVPFARAAFEALWVDGRDLGREDVVADLCRAVDADPDTILAACATPEIKALLRANTDELIARGGFGSPTIYIGETDMYFGNDRMPLIDAAIQRTMLPA